MSQIAYDPVKDKMAGFIRGSRKLRRLFYFLLDMFFLRSWHVRKKIRQVYKSSGNTKDNWNVLDAGSGFGQYDAFMLRSFRNIYIKAIDVKEDYLADCRHYFVDSLAQKRIVFENQDLLELKDSGFDFTLCVDVLEHIEQDTLVMKNLYDALEPGGYLLMHSPSHFAADDAGDDEFFVDEHARVGYSREDISKKLKSVGFDQVEANYTYGTFGHLAWVLSIKWPMLILNKVGVIGFLILPIWYAFVLLPSLILNKIDLHSTNKTGTGIYALARKPLSSVNDR